MSIRILSVPPRDGGPIAGAAESPAADQAIALFYESGSSWHFQTAAVPQSRIWNYYSSGTGERFAVAVVTTGFRGEDQLPSIGDKVGTLAVFPANRLRFTHDPPSAGGKVAGTVSFLATPAGYKVQVFRWDSKEAWVRVAEDDVQSNGSWSFSGVPAAPQYAAVLLDKADTVLSEPGFLPEGRKVVATLFQQGVELAVTTTPPANGGPIAGAIFGLNGTALLNPEGSLATKVVLFGLRPDNSVEDCRDAVLQENGLWNGEIAFGAQYAVALVDHGYFYEPGSPVPPVGGQVITKVVVTASK